MKKFAKWWKDPQRKLEVGLKISNTMRKKLDTGKFKPIKSIMRSMHNYRLWKLDILKRDNWTCVDCGKYGRYKYNKVKLEVHHLEPFYKITKGIETIEQANNNSLLWDRCNGVVLCVDCHKVKTKQLKVCYSNEK
jgi:5-methylcytosine-specific restriction endonuclease McrA